MRSRYFLIVSCLSVSFTVWGQSIQSVPIQDTPAASAPAPNAPIQAIQPGSSGNGGDFSTNTHPAPEGIVPKDKIIVRGAWSSASDSTTPVPEGAALTGNVFTDRYFGIAYPLPPNWVQKFTPPPPSDTGSYVLAQIGRSDSYKGEARGSIQFSAQDMFFTPLPAANARQLVKYSSDHLPEYYQPELKPAQTTIGGRPFTFFAYGSAAAELHWYVLATSIRCHTVEIILMNHDPKALEELVRDMNEKIKLPAEAGGTGGGNVPLCIRDYASGENVLERVEPVLTERRYNGIPVRIIIDTEGRVKHIHFLSAFPEQEKAIGDALRQWKFRPYERDGRRLEVETGIMFGRPSLPVAPAPVAEATSQ